MVKCKIDTKLASQVAVGAIIALVLVTGLIASNMAFAESPLTAEQEAEFSQNDDLYWQPCETKKTTTAEDCSDVSGDTIEEKIWSGLTSFLSEEQAAGVMGNMVAESGLNPARHESKFLNNGSFANFDLAQDGSISYGIGLIQWSGGRRVNLYKAFEEGASELWTKYIDEGRNTYGGLSGSDFVSTADDPDVNAMIGIELCFLKREIEESYKELLEKKSVEEASDYFLFKIERPAKPESTKKTRRENAQAFYEQFKGLSITNDSGDEPDDVVDVAGTEDSPSASEDNTKNIGQKIAETALRLAWSYKNRSKASSPTDAFREAAEALGSGSKATDHGDCGYFVKTVISTVTPDTVYQPSSQNMDRFRNKLVEKVDGKYKARGSNKYTKNWDVIEFDGKVSSLKSGDIVWYWDGQGSQHYWIAVEKNNKIYKVEASYSKNKFGRVNHILSKKDTVDTKHQNRFIFRAKGETADPACGNCEKGNMNLNATAACLAWPLGTDKEKYTLASGKVLESILDSPGATEVKGTGIPTPAFQKAWIDTNMYKNSLNDDTQSGHFSWRYGAYCSGFAAVVARYSGYDKNFSHAQPGADNYVRNHKDLWEIIPWSKKKEDLQGGDILYADGQHTWMVVEDESGEMYIAEASLHGYTFGHIAKYGNGNTGYSNPLIFRAKKANNSSAGVSVKGGMDATTASASGKISKLAKGKKDLGASAIELAWPIDTKESVWRKKPTNKFKNFYVDLPHASKSGTIAYGKSCDHFVYTAILHAGLGDRESLNASLYALEDDLEKSSDWEEIFMESPNKLGEYKSGDVLFFYKSGENPVHTGIYAEDSKGKYVVQASHAGNKDPGYYGRVRDTSQITGNIYSKIRVFRNKNNGINDTSGDDCDLCPSSDGDSTGDGALVDGGFKSKEEAQKAVMDEYQALFGNEEEAVRKYGLDGALPCAGGYVDNCTVFSRWFINRFAKGKMWKGEATGYGKDVARNVANFYNLKTSHTPSVYSVFSGPGSGWEGHTGIVLGIDKSKNMIIIGEAGCNSGKDFARAKEKKLSDYNKSSYTYVNLNSVLKGI